MTTGHRLFLRNSYVSTLRTASYALTCALPIKVNMAPSKDDVYDGSWTSDGTKHALVVAAHW